MDLKRPTTIHVVTEFSKGKDEEKILKAQEKTYYAQGNPHKTISKLFSRNFVGKKELG